MSIVSQPYEPETRIAVTGMSLRVPGGESPETFWKQLLSGESALRRFNTEELAETGYPPAQPEHPDFVPVHGAIQGIDQFDARLFGYPPREAELLDPQQRLLLQLAWESLEHGGLHPGRFGGRVGVFAGTGSNAYARTLLLPYPERMRELDEHAFLLSSEKDFAAGRIAYKLNLTGPALSIQTACSTGLVAVHSAVQHLLGGECDAALAGACSLQVPQEKGYRWQKGGILSRSGTCRPFDHRADGTVGGSGGVVLLLKRLEDALEERDTVYGVIAGSAVNNDGSDKAGFTAPSVGGQVSVCREALAVGGVSAQQINYVEAHGTGTEVGDPIELTALREVYGSAAGRGTPCLVGGVKAVTGHLDTASGLVGMVKAMLALHHRTIPGNPCFEQPNPRFEMEESGLEVNREPRPWPSDDYPRRAGVSSLGLGGTNAHLVLEEPPSPRRTPDPYVGPLPLPLSAESPAALATLQEEVDRTLPGDGPSLPDAAFTLQEGRRPLSLRTAKVAYAGGDSPWMEPVKADKKRERKRNNVFLFPGQGAQYSQMGATLYRHNRAFREEADRLCSLADPIAGGRCTPFFQSGEEYDALAWSQLCMLLFQLALVRWWKRAGVEPDLVMGHSLGEYAAACVAGVLDPEEAMQLIVARGRLIDGLPPGGMLTVLAEWDEIRERSGESISLAADNAPGLITVSGPAASIDRLAEELERESVTFLPLQSSRAFHSPQLRDIREAYLQALREVAWRKPRIPWLSTHTGEWMKKTGPGYWADQMANPVRFREACRRLDREAHEYRFMEIGPGSQLTGLVRRNGVCTDRAFLLAGPEDTSSELHAPCLAASQIWMQGGDIDWRTINPLPEARRVALPTYPFEQTSYWLSPPAEHPHEPAKQAGRPPAAERLRESAPSERPRLFTPGWERGRPLSLNKEQTGPVIPLLVTGGEQAREQAGRRKNARFVPPAEAEKALGGLPDSTADNPSRILCMLSGQETPSDLFRMSRLAAHIKTDNRLSHTDMIVVGYEAFKVTGEEKLDPPAAAASSLLRAIAGESPELRLGYADLERSASPDRLSALLDTGASGLLPRGYTGLVCRGRYLWERTVLQAQRPDPPSPVKAGETCLVTGGSGELGLHLASWLHGRRAEIVLMGRRSEEELNDASRTGIRRLRSEGASLTLVSGDVRDPASLREARREIRERFGPADRLFHLAGVSSPRRFTKLKEAEFRETIEVKCQGLRNLLEVFGGDEPASVTLYSSLASFGGGLGSAAYAAASAWMDALALKQVERSRLNLLNWGGWRDIGMGERLAGRMEIPEPQLAALRNAAIAPAEGREVLDCAVGSGIPQLLISKHHPLSSPRRAPGGGPSREAAPPRNGSPSRSRYRRPDLETGYKEPRNGIQRRLAGIWQEALGVEKVGIDDNFFDLGADSMLMIQVMERINAKTDASLSKTDLFEYTTIRKLAAKVDPSAGGNSETGGLRDRVRRQREALDRQSRLERKAREERNRNG